MGLELGLENAPVGFLSQLWWETVPSFRVIVAESPPIPLVSRLHVLVSRITAESGSCEWRPARLGTNNIAVRFSGAVPYRQSKVSRRIL